MKTRILTAAVALLALAGCIAPPDNASSSAAIPPPRVSDWVPIEYYQGQPMVYIGVADARFRCIIDTGSSDLVIPMPMMRRLYHEFGLTDQDVVVTGEGKAELAAGVSVHDFHIRINKVRLGSWILTNVPVLVPDDGDCLLGMTVLRQFKHLQIDIPGDRLVLED